MILEVIALNLEEKVESVEKLVKQIVSLDHTASVIFGLEVCPTWQGFTLGLGN